MPEGVSSERSKIIGAYGGAVRFSPREQGILGALDEARRLADETDAFLPLQFENPDNAEAHRVGTAREIVLELPGGTPDAVVSGVGTGGTIVGLSLGFRDHGCATKPFVARPIQRDASAVFSEAECSSASSLIPGVVEHVSKLYKPEDLDGLEVIEIADRAALECARRLIRCGFPVGPSSGLNFLAALEVVAKLGDDARVVTVFPDRMERYFSTALFDAG
jgi:cysteine synthase A